ncbi:hypothetical protein ERJ75_001452100 [Trypanosoma vivax]|uniref:Uncharacterized protein n=1 Tax=Trypanosoma vivax (strain Y486) TaxID=1055687 RepID=G0TW39_TRYVY|nr:hypothetical protein TRVL_00296 [Trypanosoma vivax]KAH8607336.1 hypothetical protein ERJ75_001452100 [Trypanosoma vivax]CCC48155.1 conserved hypothetical protein [Trypanosoma vivax Y486]
MSASNLLVLKTAVNTRAPLSERMPPVQSHDNIVPSLFSLHRTISTTCDEAYNSIPANTDASAGNHYLAEMRRRRQELLNSTMQGNSSPCKSGIASPSERVAPSPKSEGQENGVCDVTQESVVCTGAGAPALVSTRHMPGEWITEKQASNMVRHPSPMRDFYSTARKVERADDDRRGGLVGNTQRTVDIMRKRANEPILCPKPDIFPVFPTLHHEVDTDEKGRPARSCLDIVDCQQLTSVSEHGFGYASGPIDRLASQGDLPRQLAVQQRVITNMGTLNPLFAGTAKAQKYAIPNYTGHVPAHPRNVAAMLGNDDCPLRKWSKSYLTLAVHGSGANDIKYHRNPLVRNRSGVRAPQPKIPKPKTEEQIRMTMEGTMLLVPHTMVTPAEKLMNIHVKRQR